jgi:hypothetical protein
VGQEAEALVEGQMLGALGKGEQAGVAHTPLGEDRHRLVQEGPGDPFVPNGRVDRDRAEKAHAAPAGDEIRPHEPAVHLGGQGTGGIGGPPGADVVGVAHEGARVGEAEEGPEGETHDAVGLAEIGLLERPHPDINVAHDR